MNVERELVAIVPVDSRILRVRHQRVILDADLAGLYGVTSKRLGEQVRRNPKRFPTDFVFRLTARERDGVIALRPDLKQMESSRTMPRAFTEHGALMVANILNSSIAVRVSIEIVRAFVRVRAAITQHSDLARRIEALEAKYDGQFKEVFDAIDEMMFPTDRVERRIGFQTEEP